MTTRIGTRRFLSAIIIATWNITSVQSFGTSHFTTSLLPLTIRTSQHQPQHQHPYLASANNDDMSDMSDINTNDKKNTFSFAQRIESTKSGIVGLITGGIALAPISFLHHTSTLGQFEFDTDMGSLEAALFAIVYRYCLRQDDDDNPQLNQGVVAAFALTRTLSKIQVPTYCSVIPLDCGSPLGYFDWNMIGQGATSGLESVFLFGTAAAAMDYCFRKGWISRCP